MEFDSQIRKFLLITKVKSISAHAQCLYLQLLDAFKSNLFPTELKLDNMAIHRLTHLSRQQIRNARNELQNLSLLNYTNGRGSASGSYQLIDISNANINSIIDISCDNDGKITNLNNIQKEINKLENPWKFWGLYTLDVLKKAIKSNAKGIYNNYYATTQTFLKARNDFQIELIHKIVKQLEYRNDIINKEAYILAVIANEVKQNIRLTKDQKFIQAKKRLIDELKQQGKTEYEIEKAVEELENDPAYKNKRN
ncbi:MAG: hypothetical protein ACI4TT_01645 [Christensenellales bacterium]